MLLLCEQIHLALNTPPRPTISGTAEVGSTLTAHPGVRGPAPVDLAYQWRVDGEDIWGETAATYTPPEDMLGSRISVTVTGSRPAYMPLSRTSAPTAVVTTGTLTAPTPTITVTVTGRKTGYTSLARTSAATATAK